MLVKLFEHPGLHTGRLSIRSLQHTLPCYESWLARPISGGHGRHGIGRVGVQSSGCMPAKADSRLQHRSSVQLFWQNLGCQGGPSRAARLIWCRAGDENRTSGPSSAAHSIIRELRVIQRSEDLIRDDSGSVGPNHRLVQHSAASPHTGEATDSQLARHTSTLTRASLCGTSGPR